MCLKKQIKGLFLQVMIMKQGGPHPHSRTPYKRHKPCPWSKTLPLKPGPVEAKGQILFLGFFPHPSIEPQCASVFFNYKMRGLMNHLWVVFEILSSRILRKIIRCEGNILPNLRPLRPPYPWRFKTLVKRKLLCEIDPSECCFSKMTVSMGPSPSPSVILSLHRVIVGSMCGAPIILKQ